MESKQPQIQEEQLQPSNNPIDQDSKTELVNRDIKIHDDGSALIKETQLTTVKMASRDFITWIREHEKARDNIKKALSKETRELAEKDLKLVEEDIENLTPYVKECEEKTKLHYEKLKKEGMISHISKELEKPFSEINLDYMNQVWKNVANNEKDVLAALNEEQKKKFVKIKLRIMQKNRGK